MEKQSNQRRASQIIGLLLVVFGALFLVGRMFHISLWQYLWPFFLIIPGLLFFAGMVAGGKAAGPLAVPGSIVTMTGLILLYQSITGAWASWAYIWSLIFPTSVGIGLIISGLWSDSPALVKNGTRWATVGMIIFLITGAFFELLLNLSGTRVSGLLWPALLIGVGAWMLVRQRSAGTSAPPSNGHKPPMREEPIKTPVRAFEPIDPTRGKDK